MIKDLQTIFLCLRDIVQEQKSLFLMVTRLSVRVLLQFSLNTAQKSAAKYAPTPAKMIPKI